MIVLILLCKGLILQKYYYFMAKLSKAKEIINKQNKHIKKPSHGKM